jgi:hypothetical protein
MPMSPRLLRPRAAGGFDPRAISGLAVWYDAADASTFTYGTGDAVAQWDDKSGNGRHAVQTTANNRPTRSGSQNGRPTVAFAGTPNQWLTFTYTNFPQAPATYFFVANTALNQGGRAMFAFDSGEIILTLANTVFEIARAGNAVHVSVSRAGGAQLFTYWQDTNNVGTVNSASARAGASSGSTTAASAYTTSSSFHLGFLNFPGFQSWFLGQIAEVAIFDRVLLSTERDAVTAYLRAKWAVT